MSSGQMGLGQDPPPPKYSLWDLSLPPDSHQTPPKTRHLSRNGGSSSDEPRLLSSLFGLSDILEQVFGGSPVHRKRRELEEKNDIMQRGSGEVTD